MGWSEIMKRRYWAYLHNNGGIHVKMYWEGLLGKVDPALEDAHSSPFVAKVIGPYFADGREEAEKDAKKRFNKE